MVLSKIGLRRKLVRRFKSIPNCNYIYIEVLPPPVGTMCTPLFDQFVRLTRLIFHLFNLLFAFFGNTHYFGHNANLFIGIEKNNFSNRMIEGGYYREAFIRKIGNYFIK